MASLLSQVDGNAKVKKSKLTIESQSQNLKLRTKTYSRCGLVVGATGESKLFKIKKIKVKNEIKSKSKEKTK